MNLKEAMDKAFACHKFAKSIKGENGIENIGWYCGVCGKKFMIKVIKKKIKMKN